jgi:uncharacterized caspase-like protein
LASVDEGNKKALIVSVTTYSNIRLQSSSALLNFRQKDGEEMYYLLGSLGFDISDNHKLSGFIESDKMRKAIYDFFHETTADDTLLFYYTGHAVFDNQFGSIYLATSDINADKPFEAGISFDELIMAMSRSKSGRIFVILDCCFTISTGYQKTKVDETEAQAAMMGNNDMYKKARQLPEGRSILAACLTTQEAYKKKVKGHSILTYHLLEGLRGANGASIDKEGHITPESLGGYVYKKVIQSGVKSIIKTEASGKIILSSKLVT